jgi:hypothetical protein
MPTRSVFSGRYAWGALLFILLVTSAKVGAVNPTPRPPVSPTPIVPVPAKGALVQVESAVRTFVRFEFPQPPSPALDPTTADWTLTLYDTPSLSQIPNLNAGRTPLTKTYTLARGSWTSPEAGKYVYTGAAGAVTASLDARTFILEATGAEAVVLSNSTTPNANAISSILGVGGTTYYTLFGGKVWANTDTSFKAHAGPVPILSQTLSTAATINDITTGQPVAEPRQTDLKSALVFPDGETGHKTQIDINLPDGCYNVEFLWSEIDPEVNSTNVREFLVSAPELGVVNALVSVQRQLGGSELYYPGAYTASGLVRDGFLSITFVRVTGAPFINGFIITPLIGCTGVDDTLTNTTPIQIDLGGQTLPTGVYIYKGP